MTSLFTEVPAAGATPQVRSTSPLRSLIAGLVLAVAPLSVLGVAAPTAHADSAVDGSNFVGAISSRGITFASRQAATAAGHEVCDELDQGQQASDVANTVMTHRPIWTAITPGFLSESALPPSAHGTASRTKYRRVLTLKRGHC
ncbi:MAG: hypothetical protein QOI89_3954 [Solirubrobacteraceae bacterium]|jgi:hypothetical protein|nr:hypothetical protein [Mycobacterium sp.]MEA2203171.1 hypothetical protein [Solirubrobacteraceae bacterium]